jgi:FkbM family methyltransferase
VKKVLRRIVNKAGYDVVKLKNSNASLADNLANVIAAKNIGCILDVGANAGQYGVFLRELGYRGHIVSFEPVSAVFDRLKLAAKDDPKWLCFRYALGDRDEEKTINVYSSTVFSSFLDATDYSKSIWRSLNERQPEQVQVRTLSGLFPELLGRVGDVRCLLKMDTQGYDLNVFRGAQDVLPHVDALQSEIATITLYEHMPNGLDVLKVFQEQGYYVSGMYPINREQETLATIEFDCVLVKRPPRAPAAAH